MRRYLDHNATSPVDPRVAAAVTGALEVGGNPSSVHAEGRRARQQLETARRQVAAALRATADEVVLCGSGTDADVLGVVGGARLAARTGRPPRVLVAAVEHPAVAEAAGSLRREGFEIAVLPVDADGRLERAPLEAELDAGAALVAVALSNHELGTVQDVAAIAERCRSAGARLHCDAVQALGKVAIDVAALGADSVALSSHKIRGPMGAGALWLRRGDPLEAVVASGHQERGRRPGTEPLPALVGFGVAASLVAELLADQARQARLRDRFEAAAVELGAAAVGAGATRVANTSTVRFPGVPGDVLVAALDLAGFAVSSGAACTSGTAAPSPVLRAVGLDDRAAAEGLRVSVGTTTTDDDISAILEVLPEVVERGRRFA